MALKPERPLKKNQSRTSNIQQLSCLKNMKNVLVFPVGNGGRRLGGYWATEWSSEESNIFIWMQVIPGPRMTMTYHDNDQSVMIIYDHLPYFISLMLLAPHWSSRFFRFGQAAVMVNPWSFEQLGSAHRNNLQLALEAARAQPALAHFAGEGIRSLGERLEGHELGYCFGLFFLWLL